jgi:DNA-binding beta-propeller fold protein YncE
MFKRLVLLVAGALLFVPIPVPGSIPAAYAMIPLPAASSLTVAMPLSVDNGAANAVLGQPNFTSPTCNNPLLTSRQRLCHPVGVAVDIGSGRLFVSDGDNNRVLIWSSAQAFTKGQAASVVIGQPSFRIKQICGRTNARSLCDPNDLTVDGKGNLFVADTDGNRVLEFKPPFANAMRASLVIGQSSFHSNTCASGSARLCAPRSIAIDPQGNLFVIDSDNNRVLMFNAPLTSGEAAHLVIGQSNFSSNGCNRGASASASSLCSPKGITLDKAGNLYVADADNNRVLLYINPLTSDQIADRVFGQPNFTATACSTSASGLCGPHRVRVGRNGQFLVSDSDNNRVLEYSSPLSSSIANFVFGQPNVSSSAPTTSATGLAGPQGIAIDSHGNLYLTDEDNNRVLRYNAD